MKTANEIIEEFEEMFCPNEESLAKNIKKYSTATEVIIDQIEHQKILRIKSFIIKAMKTAVEEVTPKKCKIFEKSDLSNINVDQVNSGNARYNAAISDLEDKKRKFFEE